VSKSSLARLVLVLLGEAFLVGHGLLCALTWTLESPREPTVPAVQLLVDLTAFPSGWVVAGGPFSAHGDPSVLSHEHADDWAQVTFAPRGRDPADVSAIHDVYVFANSLEAAINFYTRFPEYPRYPPVIPQSLRVWSYRSPVADRFALYCWLRKGSQDCVAIGQYDEWISDFGIRLVYDDEVPRPDLTQILEAIDERMAHYLKDRAQCAQ
jgi:hypothetical protein